MQNRNEGQFIGPGHGTEVAIVESEGRFKGAVSPAGAMEVGELIRLTGGNFEINILPHRWKVFEDNGATQSVVEGELVLQTGVGVNGKVAVQSFNRAEFVTATFNKAHLAVFIDFAAVDLRTRFGMFDPVEPFDQGDGIFLEVVNGNMQFVRRKGGLVDEIVDEADFDFTKNFVKNANVNIYEIVFNAGSAILYQNRKIIHTMRFVDEVGYETVHLPVAIEIESLNGLGANRITKTRGFACSRIGTASAIPEKFNIVASGNGIIKHGPGQVERIVLGEVGAGNSTLTLLDGNDIFFGPISLTKALFSLEIGASFSNNLNFITTGAGFSTMVVYK